MVDGAYYLKCHSCLQPLPPYCPRKDDGGLAPYLGWASLVALPTDF